MKRVLLILIFTLGLLPAARAQEPITGGETLTLERCIAIALARHPSLQAAAGTVSAGEGKIGQASAAQYPQLNGSVSYSRTDPMSPASGRTPAPSASSSYTTNLSLSQNLYDFGRTGTQIRIQELNTDSSRSDLDNVRTQVTFTVKLAYWALLQADRNREVSREVVEQYRQHLDRAKAFFEVGLKPKFDVTKAEVDLSNATFNLQKTENAVRLAFVALNSAMGLTEAPDYRVADQLALEPQHIDLDRALQSAYDRRPDLKAVLLKQRSVEQSIELARKGYYPTLTGSAGYGWGGGSFPLDQGWNFGVQLSVPLFSGHSTKYQIAEAQANLEVLKANEASLRQGIYQNVKQAWINLGEAADRVTTAAVSIRQAEENLDLAKGRYAAGVGNPIEVTDALVATLNAKTSEISALFDYKLAKASLEKAIGEP
jgi:outer membrane protein TolC